MPQTPSFFIPRGLSLYNPLVGQRFPLRSGAASATQPVGRSGHMGWHKPYNISGTIHCGGRLDDTCKIYQQLLATDNVGVIGHITGATTIAGESEIGFVISTGHDAHDAFFLVPGERDNWLAFAAMLEEMLDAHTIPHALIVHPHIVNLATT